LALSAAFLAVSFLAVSFLVAFLVAFFVAVAFLPEAFFSDVMFFVTLSVAFVFGLGLVGFRTEGTAESSSLELLAVSLVELPFFTHDAGAVGGTAAAELPLAEALAEEFAGGVQSYPLLQEHLVAAISALEASALFSGQGMHAPVPAVGAYSPALQPAHAVELTAPPVDWPAGQTPHLALAVPLLNFPAGQATQEGDP
jgi:hypothetical protein